MTYCVGVSLNSGLVFVSDSRANAGTYQISQYVKLARRLDQGERININKVNNTARPHGPAASTNYRAWITYRSWNCLRFPSRHPFYRLDTR